MRYSQTLDLLTQNKKNKIKNKKSKQNSNNFAMQTNFFYNNIYISINIMANCLINIYKENNW